MPSSASFAAILVALAGCGDGLPQDSPSPTPAIELPDAAPPQVDPDAEVARASSRTAGSRYDEVGVASWYGEEMGPNARAANGERFDPAAITIAHRKLPLGSFVEITSLDTGRTIVARVTDRGPHRAGRLIDMSRGAAQLLGMGKRAMFPVRVRDVTLTPGDEAALRAGQPASERLDEPPVLLAALRKRLNGEAAPAVPAQVSMPPKAVPVPAAAITSKAKSIVKAPPKPSAAPAVTNGHYLVQIGTFSDRDHAKSLADRLHGGVSSAGKLWRVRLGPFSTSTEANRARDGAIKRGYGDAVVVRQD